MAFKVLLGLLAAVAVTGSAVYYGMSDCPSHVAGGCPSKAAVVADESDDGCPACAACSAKSRARVACCEDGDESLAAGGDAVAAVTGGVCLGR